MRAGYTKKTREGVLHKGLEGGGPGRTPRGVLHDGFTMKTSAGVDGGGARASSTKKTSDERGRAPQRRRARACFTRKTSEGALQDGFTMALQ